MLHAKRMLQARGYWDEDDGDGNQLGGGGDDKDGGKGDDSAAVIAQLKEGLNGAMEGIKTLAAGQTQFQSQMAEAIAQLAAGNKKDDDSNKEEPPLSEDDLETMPRKDLIALITKTVMKGVDQKLTEVNGNLKGLGDKLGETITRGQVTEMQKDNKDLLEWKAEIGVALNSGRSNNIQDAYRLVRQDDPEKAKAMDKKYNPPAASKKDEEGFAGVFKGFSPKSGGNQGKSTTMKPAAAAAAAWDEATANMPGIEQFMSQ